MPPLASATKPPPSWKPDPVSATPSIVSSVPSAAERAAAIGVAGGGIGVGSGGTGVGMGVGTGGIGVETGSPPPGAGVGGEVRFCGSGTTRATKSDALSSVSCDDPRSPPGSRSMLLPASGTTEEFPSRQVLVAVPHPTASIADVAPMIRMATLPPVAAIPLA